MKTYTYKNVTYKSEQEVRKAIFKHERKAFRKVTTAEDWAKFGVVYAETEPQLTQAQLARQARLKRNRLLSACDYYVMLDYPSSEQGLIDVKAYRQALRDISQQDGFPYQIDWPVKPSVLG